MLISEDASLSKYVIKSYSATELVINEAHYYSSLIVTPETLISDWRPRNFAELKLEDFAILLKLNPEFVLLGMGTQFQSLPTQLKEALSDKLIIETMSTGAACRSFCVLSSEGRNVAAAIIL